MLVPTILSVLLLKAFNASFAESVLCVEFTLFYMENVTFYMEFTLFYIEFVIFYMEFDLFYMEY
jgi:hypothetical protein